MNSVHKSEDQGTKNKKYAAISSYKISLQTSSGSHDQGSSVNAQGSLKSHVNQLRPYAAQKNQKSRPSKSIAQNKILDRVSTFDYSNPKSIPGKGPSQQNNSTNIPAPPSKKQSATRKLQKRQSSPIFMDFMGLLGDRPPQGNPLDSAQPPAFFQSNTMNNAIPVHTSGYREQIEIIRATKQSLWDQRLMLYEESLHRGRPKRFQNEKNQKLVYPFQKQLLNQSIDMQASSLKQSSILRESRQDA